MGCCCHQWWTAPPPVRTSRCYSGNSEHGSTGPLPSARGLWSSPHIWNKLQENSVGKKQDLRDQTGRVSNFKKKCITVMQKSAEILFSMLTTQKLSVCVSSPYSSPHTQGSRPCRRTACPAGGDDSSYSRNNWSGRVYSWLELPAAYVTEPRHISHKPLQDDRREEEKCWREIRRFECQTLEKYSSILPHRLKCTPEQMRSFRKNKG